MDTRIIQSDRLPGGDLITAVLDRQVMRLGDRGGASNLVGERWADVCADYALGWCGEARPVPDYDPTPLVVSRVARLDAIPEIAAVASKRKLQNPDLLVFGTRGGVSTIQAADAKFSVETARGKQVSPAVVDGMLGLRTLFPDIFASVGDAPRIVPGVFLCPDSTLTALMLRHRQGIVRAMVRPDEVVLVPVTAADFVAPLDGHELMTPLAAIDALGDAVAQNLLAALFYFRLARASIGCWLDATKPLLLLNDRSVVDEVAVLHEVIDRGAGADSALDLILRWDADVQTVREARTAVDQAASLPLHGRDLRPMIARLAEETALPPPSVNKVRRRLGDWYRRQLREQIGPFAPPVADLPRALTEIARVGSALTPDLDREAERVIRSLIAERHDAGETD